MRYRKRIKLAQGVNLNLSKSGASLSFGVKGASITVGKNGTYSNVSIPGLGLYSRKKISHSKSTQTKKSSNKIMRSNSTIPSTSMGKFSLNIDDTGNVVIKDQYNCRITDESYLRKIKKTEEYKRQVQRLSRKKLEFIEEETEKFINIYKFTPEIKGVKDYWMRLLEELAPQNYIEEQFGESLPSISDLKDKFVEYANENVKSVLFWRNKAIRAKFVEENFEKFHQSCKDSYDELVSEHNEKEKERKLEIEKRNIENNLYRDTIVNKVLTGDEEYVTNMISSIINDIKLPISFSIDYEYDPQGRLLIDLDLPEIEDLPTTKAHLLQSGKESIKNKTTVEIKRDYAICVCGLAFYFSGVLFNVSPKISEIIISGYTQRVSEKSGNIEDQYIYSVFFKRDVFEQINVTNIDPVIAISNFEAIIDITKTFEFKSIIPLTRKSYTRRAQ